MRFKINWASLTVGSKFTFFALFYFVFEGNYFVKYKLPGRQFNGGFFALLVWGAYIWRGLFSEFYCIFLINVQAEALRGGERGGFGGKREVHLH